MLVVHEVVVEVAAELLQRRNHVVNLHAIDQLRVVAKFCLDPVELRVELFEIRKLIKGEIK